MKPPKRINFNRVTMWYQDGSMTIGVYLGPRIRIFYPNGKSEWCTLQRDVDGQLSVALYAFYHRPCWMRNIRPGTATRAFQLAQEYDKSIGFGPMEFLGYL